ncbi:MAG: COP23 domain-containing protein [Oscillatoria princeps RMCB-10]|jgi:hypothetical protein|nr:COP23 domain-containing protein [Oscillatoria princeps RMCB-10]
MKLQSLTTILTAAALAIGATASLQRPSQAQNTTFQCGVWVNGPNAGVAVTYARTPRGVVPIINWVSDHFSDSGYTPMRRCLEVTSRFQSAYNNGTLNYITTGVKNGQPVVCVTSASNGPCSSILFTLKPGTDASRTLQAIFDIQNMGAAAAPLYESDSTSIDMKAVLSSARTVEANQINAGEDSSAPSAPVAQPAEPASAPSVTSPAAQPSNPGSGRTW